MKAVSGKFTDLPIDEIFTSTISNAVVVRNLGKIDPLAIYLKSAQVRELLFGLFQRRSGKMDFGLEKALGLFSRPGQYL